MADEIKIGNLEISSLKVGSYDCEAYLGDVKVYPSVETRLVAKFNVTSTSSPTRIAWSTFGFSKIEIDGVEVMITTGYTFDEVGEHTGKYTLTNPTSIGNDAFNKCSGLTSVDIPNSVTSIGAGAFGDCSSLTSIVIPSGVTSIYQYAFQNCTSLTSINFPSGVTIIDNQAFFQCRSLTSIDIPDTVTNIGNSTFAGCTGLTSITVDNNNANYSSEDGVLFNKAKTTLIQYPIGNSLTSYSIPNSVTSIGTYAFYGCSSLTSCTIGSGVTSIGQSVFRSCTSLTSIVSNVTTAPTIQNFTFYQVKTGGTLTVPIGSSGYDVWMGTGNYYLGMYNWTKVEQ